MKYPFKKIVKIRKQIFETEYIEQFDEGYPEWAVLRKEALKFRAEIKILPSSQEMLKNLLKEYAERYNYRVENIRQLCDIMGLRSNYQSIIHILAGKTQIVNIKLYIIILEFYLAIFPDWQTRNNFLIKKVDRPPP